ncbi:MAG: type IV pilus secretin PilQ [Desulfobacterales bacterium]|nr:type IV pilus secretin PilQ [Desulfobacterales bacterium]
MKSELFLINRIFRGMVVFLSVFAAGSIGICVSDSAATVSEPEGTRFSGKNPSASESPLKRITDMTVNEDAESINLLVKANRLLTYTSVKQPFPPTIILYFSNTFLDIGRSPSPKEYKIDMSGSSIISSAIISEENGTGRSKPGSTSKIEISLKKDAPYNIIREGSGLKISFSKTPAPGQWPVASRNNSGTDSSGLWQPAGGQQPVIGTRQPADSYHTASRLQSVYATKLEDGLKVFVGADGTITNYKVFTIGSPASIVFDIFDIKSPYKNEKKVAVDTRWVRQVRYFGYPDRLRLILDTEKIFLHNFSAYPVDNGLLIHVGGKGAKQGIRYAETDPSELRLPSPALKNVPRSGMPAATRLQSVYATQFKNGIIVTVRGDGAITDYKASTIDNPPSIVFDMFNVSSGYEKKDSFPVDTQWVKRVRHESHPDRLRLFIDTQKRYLSAFSAYPDKNGLVIYVGEKDTGLPVVARRQEPRRKRYKRQRNEYRRSPGVSRRSQITNRRSPAWVNQLDFVSEDAGKSKLVIGTTSAVEYDMAEESDKKLRLRLVNTRIPDYRQRPLIGPGFETAVDRITPMHANNNESVFSIDLLEAVPYFVEQTDTLLTVHFEASSIPPPAPVVAARRSDYGAETASLDREFEIEVSGDTVPGKAGASVDLPEAPSSFEPDAELYSDMDESPDAEETSASDDSFDMTTEPRRKYTGEKIALDFFDTDIKNVFRILREVSGKNFAVDKDVGGKVTLTLEHPVPWDQVLDLVLKMNKLGKILEGNIIRIATDRTIDAERKQREKRLIEKQELKKKEKEVQPLVTEYIPVNYSDAASEIKPHLEKFLTEKRGTISVDKRTNMIIMTDIADNIKKAKLIVERIDKVTPQVIIEAKIVEANTSFSRNLGTEWNMSVGLTTKTSGTALSEVGRGPQRGYDILGGTYGYDMAMNLPSEFANFGSIGFNFTRIAGTPFLLEAKLVAMEQEGNGKIISAPKILTLDNKSATINQGYEFPYVTYSEDQGTNVEFKSISLTMTVTPHITPDNRISMKVSINKNDVYEDTSPPAMTTKSANTELLVNDGDTIVIGGIVKESDTMSITGLPALSKIPVIGWLFGSKKSSSTRQELLIFITPKIVQLEQRAQY